MLRTTKKFSTRAEAILRLGSIGNNPFVVVSHVPHGAHVEVVAPSSLLAGSAQDEPKAEAEADEGEPADADEPSEDGEVAEGVDAGGAAEQTADEFASTLIMDYPTLFTTAFAEAVAVYGLDADDSPTTTPTAGLNDDAKWDKYPLGQLPGENDPDAPLDTMVGGLRSVGGTLASLFDVGVVGKLAPMTCIGAIVE
jgi:hypothetical protein